VDVADVRQTFYNVNNLSNLLTNVAGDTLFKFVKRNLFVYVLNNVVYPFIFARALDVRLREWCCSVSMVWVQIPSREEQKFDILKSNSSTVWFNFQTYIYINKISSVIFSRKANLGINLRHVYKRV
jgi:hypothetical protein